MQIKVFIPVALVSAAWIGAARAQVATQPDRVVETVRAIEQSEDPSATVAVFAASLERTNPAVVHAYILRMVHLGLPGLAYQQAKARVANDMGDGLDWAVIAYVQAEQQKMNEAALAIDKAVRLSPADAFVQATAGQLVAWFDTYKDPAPPATVAVAIDNVRKVVGSLIAYVQSYNQARSALAQMMSDRSTTREAGATTAVPPATDTTPTYYPPPDYRDYVQPYYSGGWGLPWVWGAPSFFSSSVIVEPFFLSHGFFHHRFPGRDDLFRDRFLHKGFVHRGNLANDRLLLKLSGRSGLTVRGRFGDDGRTGHGRVGFSASAGSASGLRVPREGVRVQVRTSGSGGRVGGASPGVRIRGGSGSGVPRQAAPVIRGGSGFRGGGEFRGGSRGGFRSGGGGGHGGGHR